MPLQPLNLTKPGETPNKLQLNLAKPARFEADIFWDDDSDVDGHALAAINSGSGAKVTSFDQVLSTYNSPKTNSGGILQVNPDGSFQTRDGSLHHSGDARTGLGKVRDEIITIDGSKLPPGVNEIPIFATIHPARSRKFGDIKSAGILIKNDAGVVLCEYELTKQFAQFDAVQMGSLILDPAKGWMFAELGVGFVGNFNNILEQFS